MTKYATGSPPIRRSLEIARLGKRLSLPSLYVPIALFFIGPSSALAGDAYIAGRMVETHEKKVAVCWKNKERGIEVGDTCNQGAKYTWNNQTLRFVEQRRLPWVTSFNSKSMNQADIGNLHEFRRAAWRKGVVDLNKDNWTPDLPAHDPAAEFKAQLAYVPPVRTTDEVDALLRNYVSEKINDHDKQWKQDLDKIMDEFAQTVRKKLAKEIKANIETIVSDTKIDLHIHIHN